MPYNSALYESITMEPSWTPCEPVYEVCRSFVVMIKYEAPEFGKRENDASETVIVSPFSML